MGFNQTAVKTAVEEIGSEREETLEPPEQSEIPPKIAASETRAQSSRQRNAVLCGSYRRGIPSLLQAYEKLSAAGMRVLSPSGVDFVAGIDGFLPNDAGTRTEATQALRLDCIRAADLVWLHAPDGYVGISGALEIGFARAAGVPVYAEEIPSDVALCSLVTICPLDEAIATTGIDKKGSPSESVLPRQESNSGVARRRRDRSAQDVIQQITEEIGEEARQNPGQRQRRSRDSKTEPGPSPRGARRAR
jgi:hypothetical protein